MGRANDIVNEKDAAQLLRVSRTRLSHMRRGRNYHWRTKLGEPRQRFIPPILNVGEHYVWLRGNVYYTSEGLRVMRAHTHNKQ